MTGVTASRPTPPFGKRRRLRVWQVRCMLGCTGIEEDSSPPVPVGSPRRQLYRNRSRLSAWQVPYDSSW
jgi:hypothetical protein